MIYIHGNGNAGGHTGEMRTQANIAERFYWRTITEDAKAFVSVNLYNYEIALFSNN